MIDGDFLAETDFVMRSAASRDILTFLFSVPADSAGSLESLCLAGVNVTVTDEQAGKFTRASVFTQCTRPDITFAVNRLCRHLQAPNTNCFKALDHLIRYLAGNAHLGLVYSGSSNSLKLEAYADASYGSEHALGSRSHSGYIVYLGGAPVDWSSNLQSTVALSSAESEMISAFSASRTIVYFRHLLEEFGHAQSGATVIWEDNEACIAQSKNPVNHKRCKHVLLKYHYLRDLTEASIVKLQYVCTKDQIADLLTKPLPPALFARLVPFLVRPC
jgi:hypothetical protein